MNPLKTCAICGSPAPTIGGKPANPKPNGTGNLCDECNAEAHGC